MFLCCGLWDCNKSSTWLKVISSEMFEVCISFYVLRYSLTKFPHQCIPHSPAGSAWPLFLVLLLFPIYWHFLFISPVVLFIPLLNRICVSLPLTNTSSFTLCTCDHCSMHRLSMRKTVTHINPWFNASIRFAMVVIWAHILSWSSATTFQQSMQSHCEHTM